MINRYAQAQEIHLKNKEMLRDENDKQVCMITGETLKNKEIFRDEKGKWVFTYSYVVYTGEIINEIDR